jgi:hypothetical protein
LQALSRRLQACEGSRPLLSAQPTSQIAALPTQPAFSPLCRLQVKEHSLRNLVKQAAETEARLGGHLRLYQIHSATLDSGVFDSQEVLQELGRIKAGGGWRVGLSLSGAAPRAAPRAAMSRGGRPRPGPPVSDSRYSGCCSATVLRCFRTR